MARLGNRCDPEHEKTGQCRMSPKFHTWMTGWLRANKNTGETCSWGKDGSHFRRVDFEMPLEHPSVMSHEPFDRRYTGSLDCVYKLGVSQRCHEVNKEDRANRGDVGRGQELGTPGSKRRRGGKLRRAIRSNGQTGL